jgi:carboxyvinyl-carboxyphosphonate phosphorylmutase
MRDRQDACPRLRLRAKVAEAKCFAPVSVFDPMSARIAEDLGAPAIMLAGSVAALSVLAGPDDATLTLSELSGLVRRICRVCAVPLIVDADHGYGNAMSVIRTVEELEHAGAAAITIEDTLLPQPFGGEGEPRLVPIDEACAKLNAALSARRDGNLMIIGRTGGAGLADPEDVARRMRAYADLGCDMVFVRGVETREQVLHVTEGMAVPVFLGTSNPDLRDPDWLAGRNVRVVLKGHRPMAAAYHAARAAMAAELGGGAPPAAMTAAELKALYRGDDAEERAGRFLGAAPSRSAHHT